MTHTDNIEELANIGLKYYRLKQIENDMHSKLLGKLYEEFEKECIDKYKLSFSSILKITQDYYGIPYYE